MCTKIGLYIHIPFCKRKCFYCDFVSVEYKEELSKSYISSLLKEAGHYKNEKINTIYIGGGTPSVLPGERIEYLMKLICDRYSIAADAEISLECNPGTVDIDKFKAYPKDCSSCHDLIRKLRFVTTPIAKSKVPLYN